MKKTQKLVTLLLAIVLVVSMLALVACNKPKVDDGGNKIVKISTTTSVNDSGLMAYLQPYFKADTGYDWEIASAGTGAAIQAARLGNADVILVHSKAQEEPFVAEGFARKVEGYKSERVSFMHNFFIIVGPDANPAGIAEGDTAAVAFNKIAKVGAKFISRDDNSGTHTKELSIWKTASEIEDSSVTLAEQNKDYKGTAKSIKVPTGEWYVQAGTGMGASLTIANEESAYILTDKSTYLSYKKKAEGDKLPNLVISLNAADDMKNTYSILAVNPDGPFVGIDGEKVEKGKVKIDTEAANVFVKWMTSDHAKALIAFYGNTAYGEGLFTIQGGYLA